MNNLWRGQPAWLQWTLISTILTFLILLGNAVGALERLQPLTPVTWGALETWAVPKITVAQLESKISNQLVDLQWDQVIYRTKDLEFQLELLKSQELMLVTAIADAPDVSFELRTLRQARLTEVRENIESKTIELSRLVCLIENRARGGSNC